MGVSSESDKTKGVSFTGKRCYSIMLSDVNVNKQKPNRQIVLRISPYVLRQSAGNCTARGVEFYNDE